jgi:hypothetical protein
MRQFAPHKIIITGIILCAITLGIVYIGSSLMTGTFSAVDWNIPTQLSIVSCGFIIVVEYYHRILFLVRFNRSNHK